MVDLNEVRIVVPEPPPPPKPRRVWWGLVGMLVSMMSAGILSPAVNHNRYEDVRGDALLYIYFGSAGAAIGIAFELYRDRYDEQPSPIRFSLKTLFVLCYIAGVALYIVRGILIIRGL